MEHVIYVDSNNRDQVLFPNSNTFTVHLTTPLVNITKVELMSAILNITTREYITLDITELRTPTHQIADSFTKASTPTSNAYSGSFATVPATSLMFNSSYTIQTEYPSRIDKLDRLTITWRQPNNGDIFIDGTKDMGRNMFILRFETVPVIMEHLTLSLPAPVEWDSGERQKLIITCVAAVVGFILIMLLKNKRNV